MMTAKCILDTMYMYKYIYTSCYFVLISCGGGDQISPSSLEKLCEYIEHLDKACILLSYPFELLMERLTCPCRIKLNAD